MKCTQCDSKSLTKINLEDLFYVSGDASLKTSNTLEVYVCKECGHLEFFDNAINTKQKEEQEVIEKFDKELKILIEKRDFIKTGKLKELTEELSKVEKQLTSLDITIRQQQELKKQVRKLNAEIKKVNVEIYKIDTETKELEDKKKRALQEVETRYHSRFPRW